MYTRKRVFRYPISRRTLLLYLYLVYNDYYNAVNVFLVFAKYQIPNQVKQIYSSLTLYCI